MKLYEVCCAFNEAGDISLVDTLLSRDEGYGFLGVVEQIEDKLRGEESGMITTSEVEYLEKCAIGDKCAECIVDIIYPRLAYHYSNMIGERWRDAEKIILTSSKYACLYAIDVMKSRWPEAEKIIMSDNHTKKMYEEAFNNKTTVLAKLASLTRSPAELHQFELLIAKHKDLALDYARDVIKGRWQKGESIILSDALYAYYYAKDVIKGRWPEAEEIIISMPGIACNYARFVIKGRWPEAEEIILTKPKVACQYAKDVIKGRWHKAEKIIMSDNHTKRMYEDVFSCKL